MLEGAPTDRLRHDLRRLAYGLRRPGQFRELYAMRARPVVDGEYSYLPLVQTRSVFIHIPKTAGVSVCQQLYGGLGPGHRSAGHFRLVFSSRRYASYFRFTFVRNPWDRLHSAFRFLRRGGMNANDQRWGARHLDGLDFEGFVMDTLARGLPDYIHFKPQLDFLDYRGRIDVDFVGRYETLERDFATVARRLGRPEQLPHLNPSSGGTRTYHDAYTAPMVDRVGELYRADADAFGYSFER